MSWALRGMWVGWVGLAFGTPTAVAADPAAVLARLDAVSGWRALRQAPDVPVIPADAYARVATGEVQTGLVGVDGVKAKKAWGATLVDLPIGRLFAAVNDEVGASAYTAVDYTEILSGTACASGRRVLQFLPIPIVSDRWWITILQHNTALRDASAGAVRELWWSSSVDPAEIHSERGREIALANTPLGYTKGGWLLVSVDPTTTLLEYYVWSDPGGSIPAHLASRFATGGIEDAFVAIRRFAAEGRPACPAD